ncbi:MAG: HdeD family acid-resistance protein [Verrucomicrobiales bacterium]
MSDALEQPDRQQVAEVASFLWWITLIRGVLLIGLGVYALFRPEMSALALTQVVAVIVILEGIFAIIAAILGDTPSRGSTLARGAGAILLGILVLANSALAAKLAATTLLYIIGAAVIVIGVMEIVTAIRLRKEIQGEAGLILCGVLWVIFGVLLFIAPLTFGVLMVRILGAFAILAGISLVVLAFKIRGLKKAL